MKNSNLVSTALRHTRPKRTLSLLPRSFSSSTHENESLRGLMFPGQGAQYVGMGKDLVQEFKIAGKIFDQVNESLKLRLDKLMFDGPHDELQLTEFAQPALVTHSMAILAILQNEIGFDVSKYSAVLGHSLGEFSALCASGALTLEDTVKLVRFRGKSMQECIHPKYAGMVALMPVDLVKASFISTKASQETKKICEIANINSPSQIVLSGHIEAIEAAITIAGDASIMGSRIRSRKLDVSAPFHSSLMTPAAKKLEEELSIVSMNDTKIPLVSNVTASKVQDAKMIRKLMVQQVTSPVRWSECIQHCSKDNIKSFVEIGAGKVLSGLVKQIDPKMTCKSLSTAEEVKEFLRAFKN